MQRERGHQHPTNDPLQDSEALLRAMIENLPGGAAFVVDRDLRYLLAEGEALAIAGFKPEDFVGQTIFEVLSPDLATYYEPMYRQALAGEPFEHEHSSHNRFYISRGTPLRSAEGEVYAVLAVSYDITDRKRAEAGRQQAEAAIAADLRETQLLQDLSTRLITEADIQVLYDEILAGAIALMQADAGSLQVLDEATQELVIIAIQGNTSMMAEHFHRVNASSNTPCGIALATGQRTFTDFDVPDHADPDGSLRLHRQVGFLSAQSTPLITRSGKAIGMISTHWCKHYRPSDRELRFLDLLARQAADLIKHRQAEQLLRESEAKYRSLFTSIDEAYAVVEVLADDNGEWDDFLFLEVNPAFVAQTSMEYPVGRKATDLLGTPNPHWAKVYGQVAETGEPIRFEEGEATLGRVFDLYVFRLGGAGSRRVAVLFTDITERKRREANLAFLADLMNDFAPLATAEDIMEMAGKRIAEHLNLSRYLFVEINPEAGECTYLLPSRPPGQLEISGSYILADYHTEEENRLLSAGHSMVVNDVRDGTRSPEQIAAFEAFDIVSIVNTPYLSNGRWVFDLGVTRNKPSVWREDEIELLREISARVWLRIERARAEAQLRHAAELDAFRVKLSDALRSLSDAIEIYTSVTRIALNFFGADRCYYCEIIDGNAIIRRDASRKGLPSVAGVYSLSNFPIFKAVIDAGRPLVVEDAHTTDLLDEGLRQLCCEMQVISFINVPVIKEGESIGAFCITQSTPRNWTALETELAQETAERIWATIERARAEKALHESEIQRIREQSAREEERQRAESLAELDLAKTLFFSNISHEFRTPLTLSLAPLQDALRILEEWESGRVGDGKITPSSPLTLTPSSPLTLTPSPSHPLTPSLKQNLQLVHRNNLRLLKLVNTLLDFSRIEAGRVEAVYEPTDLATFTAELASVFRSAIERADLQLIVDCPPLLEPVFVDREMWEKIVLNLLSNAFKFTFEGEIRVSLRVGEWESGRTTILTPSRPHTLTPSHPHAILQICDTGTGIAPEHLPHLFERFYQVRGTQARTHEGSGIGLALVHELVRLHGGTIAVSSTVGEGTCFTITLTFGTEHLPSDRLHLEGDRLPTRTLASTAMGATSYVEEAERWILPQNAAFRPPSPPTLGGTGVESPSELGNLGGEEDLHISSSTSPAHVLLVDDNADMREYLTRILSEYVQVEAVADGATALAIAQERIPDLILSDVMMPGLDGFELLEALRANPQTREVPIILLSARAGEEAIVEGLEAGADDYLIKPFSAQELVSRVIAHLQMAQLRGEALQQARSKLRSRDEFISVVSHELNTPLVSILGWTRMLRSSPPNPVMLSKALDTIERNATLQGKLIQDLLDLSRITAGKLRLNPQPIELQPVLETAIATVTQTAADKGIHLTWQENATEPLVVMGDSDRLCQVICNLLTNAIKFTPESGRVMIELSVVGRNGEDKGEGEVGVDGEDRGDGVDGEDRGDREDGGDQTPFSSSLSSSPAPSSAFAQIIVTDTGIGIAADFLPHVFDRFRQAEGAHSAKGLGLGLAIARHIVELHHGMIHAQSAGEGQGATFTVRLPLLRNDGSEEGSDRLD